MWCKYSKFVQNKLRISPVKLSKRRQMHVPVDQMKAKLK